MVHTFVTQIFKNETLADTATNIIEYETHNDPSWDPFSDIWNATTGGIIHTMSM